MDNYDYTAPLRVTSLGLSYCVSTTLPHGQRKTTDKLTEAKEHFWVLLSFLGYTAQNCSRACELNRIITD